MKILKPAFRIAVFVMLLWGSGMLLPVLLISDSWEDSRPLVLGAFCCFLLSAGLHLLARGHIGHVQPRALFMATAFNWILLSVTGTLPLFFSSHGIGFVDSLFESVSGITTTGASVLPDIEALPPGLLLWRSITQWIGGIGIILVAIAVMPSLKGGGMKLFRSEFSEWNQLEGGRIDQIALRIVGFYLFTSLLCFVAYRFGGMPWLEALNHMMATVSTGGFSIWNDSFGHYQDNHLQLISSFFMLLGACPFLGIVLSLSNRNLTLLRDPQTIHLLLMTLTSALLMTGWRLWQSDSGDVADVFESSFFNVVSIATTTGFASEDYGLWGSFPVMIMCFLMFSGGASGSTSGGIKLFRYHLLFIFMQENTHGALHPRISLSRQYNGHPLRDDVLLGSLAFFCFVIVALCISASLLALSGLDPVTSITGALSALMNVGPGFGDTIGPAGNYGSLPDFAKLVLTVDMLLGRLEYLTLVIIFTREFWKW
jgi:trk system potassium uptake protein